jgi:lysozyme family protein
MTTLERAMAIVLHEEGGLVDNLKDPGGLTNFGISQRSYPNVDIRNLDRDKATAIYVRDYWQPAHCADMPWPLCLFVFDHAVNAAIRLLQRTLGVNQDGAFGPVSASALAKADLEKVCAAFLVGRIDYYLHLSTAGTFGVGWCGRVARVALFSKGV